MPTSLLSSLIGWAATHLVAITLLVFVLAGFVVFGVVDIPVGKLAGSMRHEPSVQAQGPQPSVAATGAPQQSKPTADAGPEGPRKASDARPGTVPGDAERPRERSSPRLIGGSLPVYESDPGSITGFSHRPAGDPFRPPSETPAVEKPSRDELVQDARRAFWNGDFEAAERGYLNLLTAYPEDANAFGELGNLYHSMGRREAALDAYFEAGLRLRTAGEEEKLLQIIGLLSEEGDPRVDQLTP